MSLGLDGATSPEERSETVRAASIHPLWMVEGATAAPSARISFGYPAALPRTSRRVPLCIVSGLLRVVDCVAVFVAGWFAFVLLLADTAASPLPYVLLSLCGSFLAANALQLARVYQPSAVRQPLSSLDAMIKALLTVALIFIVAGFLTKTSAEWSRLWAGAWLVLTIVSLTGARMGLFVLAQHWTQSGALRRHIAVVGAGLDAECLLAHIAASDDPTVRVVGVFDDQPSRDSVAGYPVRGCVADLQDVIDTTPVDEVIVALPWTAEDSLLSIFSRLRCLPVDVRLAPGPIAYRLLDRQVSHLARVPLLHVADRPLDDWASVLKWLEDRILTSLILLLIAAPMALIALAIKLDSPGPVLFRQKRYGFNNRLIEVLKFRTMRTDRCDDDGVISTQMNDVRLTRVGAFLRRTSLDELPQFINVLRGEMSIVGPRPHATQTRAGDKLLEEIVAEYAVRHKVKPGITGWAQVNGWRGTIDTIEQLRKRIEFDIYYLENWSLMLDLKIIALTVLKGFVSKNAY